MNLDSTEGSDTATWSVRDFEIKYEIILPAYIIYSYFNLPVSLVFRVYYIFSIMLTISFLLYSFEVLTEYNLNNYKWMVSSEADVLNKNVSCSVIEVVLYYSISIHEIVIKFYMSNDSFKYYYRLCK
jgi:hypothetical protein